MTGFFTALDELVRSSSVTIDRPAGSTHPRHIDVVYPVDYGYLEGTRATENLGVQLVRR